MYNKARKGKKKIGRTMQPPAAAGVASRTQKRHGGGGGGGVWRKEGNERPKNQQRD